CARGIQWVQLPPDFW
nr:immunoglobulin heavy chain junction region [Macaca mulatta]MOX38556.1 immunoglobulin heavy chain junction region [Macaca mulatta]MOX39058.1 immunoglobulin heavy chain junction region [Macaca mulatta]MOX39223.1 immunoglobulin heavy chain junction region [Macaca mulatta]MOX39401.1 immunoglobulin heavy chain junction region [Macaca mulatta]